MGNVNWSKTTSRYNEKSSLINSNVSRTDWIGFMDALGWTETIDGNYCGLGGYNNAYAGIYQIGKDQLSYMNFYNGIGKQLLGVTSINDLVNNPIAQELAGLMEFCGIPDIGTSFDSKYLATKKAFSKFDRLLGKTFTIQYENTSGQIVGSDTVTFTQAGISAAAHLVGQGVMGQAMSKIYADCFNSEGVQTSSTATLSTVGYADGAGIAFSTYMKLMQNDDNTQKFDISTLIAANSDTSFNTLVQELITYRKDKIINYMTSHKQETAMAVSSDETNFPYRETVRAIMVGLSLPTDNLNAVDGQVVLVGAANTKYTDKADLIFGLGNVDNVLTGGKGNDTLYGGGGDDLLSGGEGNDVMYGDAGNDVFFGGQGNDTMYGGADNDVYFIEPGDGGDTIEDKEGMNKVILCFKEINFFYDAGSGQYKSPDGTLEGVMVGTDLVVTHQPTGTTVRLNDNFQWGDFGTTLITLPANPDIGNTINGDLAPVDMDPGQPGIQYGYDQWGNVIVDPSTPSPNRADYLYDTPAADKIIGGGGDDYVVSSRGGANWILGGDGYDLLDGENSSSSIIEGGAGSDIIFGGDNGNNQLFGDSRGDMAALIAAGETAADSGAKGDVVGVGRGNNFLYGSNGYDIVCGGNGRDLIVGGGGNDLIIGDSESMMANYGDNYNWSFSIQEGFDPVYNVTTYTPVITGLFYYDLESPLDNEDVIYAGTGDDYVDAGGGDDEVYGGAGNDKIFGMEGNDFIEGGDSDDLLVGDNGPYIPLGLNGDDYIDGGAGNDSIQGDGGNDVLFGGIGNDTLFGGEGDDYLDGEAGLNTLYGEAGNDVIFGGDDNDFMAGGSGADAIYGGGGNDQLHGDGPDVPLSDQGDDYINREACGVSLWGQAWDIWNSSLGYNHGTQGEGPLSNRIII